MMIPPILHFLIVFDHRTQESIELHEFDEDIDAALAAYAEKEERFCGDRSVEVVLLGSDSLESVKETHSLCFPEKGLQEPMACRPSLRSAQVTVERGRRAAVAV